MTHILIKISDIEELLNNIQSACNLPHGDDVLISRKFTEQYLKDCKQISLSKEDIEKKAENSWVNSITPPEMSMGHFEVGYIQALKDLI